MVNFARARQQREKFCRGDRCESTTADSCANTLAVLAARTGNAAVKAITADQTELIADGHSADAAATTHNRHRVALLSTAGPTSRI